MNTRRAAVDKITPGASPPGHREAPPGRISMTRQNMKHPETPHLDAPAIELIAAVATGWCGINAGKS
jgi:hypothetical protein